ncbi:DMT family transporter [Deferrisoma palaeochoriense]
MRPGPGWVLTGGVGVISTAAILIRLCEAPSLAIAAYRLGIAAALLVAYDLWRTRRLPPRSAWPWFGAAGVCLAAHFALWIASLRYTTVAASVVLVTTNPLFVALFAWLLGEPPDRRTLAGIGLGLAGAGLIGWGDFGGGTEPLLGDLLALGGALAMSAYLTVGRRARRGLPARTYSTWVYAVAAAVLAAAVLVTGTPLGPYPPATYGWLLALALGPQILGHTAINATLSHLTAPAVALAILGEPVGSTILAYLILGEVPSWQTVGGGSLILAGIAAGFGLGGRGRPAR